MKPPLPCWTDLTNLSPDYSGTMMLLTDGTVMMQGYGTTNTWYNLTPDASGSYVNGAWTSLASMSLQRLYFGSNVLNDGAGSVFLVGGEYSGPTGASNWTNTGEIYNPVTNTWSAIKNFPQTQFGDDPTMLLPNGQILAGYLSGPQTYIYNPTLNTWTATTGSKLNNDRSDEESWVKLPDNSILTYDVFSSASTGVFHAERYIPSSNQWVDASSVSSTSPPKLLSGSSVGYELGAGLLLPDGRVFYLGGNGNTAFYSPSANQWSAGPVLPTQNGTQLVAADAPAAMMPNGDVLMALSPLGALNSQGEYNFPSPTYIYEFNPTTDTYTNVTPPSSIINLSSVSSYICRMLVLPSGQILFNNEVNNQLVVYTPNGTPVAAGQPTISSVTSNGGGSYILTGTTLNGINAGAAYGDDAEMDSNYPIVRLTSGSNVYYARTYSWNATGVGAANGATSTQFSLPSGLPAGTYSLSVVANGIASDPFSFTYGGPNPSAGPSASSAPLAETGGNTSAPLPDATTSAPVASADNVHDYLFTLLGNGGQSTNPLGEGISSNGDTAASSAVSVWSLLAPRAGGTDSSIDPSLDWFLAVALADDWSNQKVRDAS